MFNSNPVLRKYLNFQYSKTFVNSIHTWVHGATRKNVETHNGIDVLSKRVNAFPKLFWRIKAEISLENRTHTVYKVSCKIFQLLNGHKRNIARINQIYDINKNMRMKTSTISALIPLKYKLSNPNFKNV